MGSVYLIGTEKGPCHIGIGDRPETKIGERIVENPSENIKLLGQWPLKEPSGLGMIVKIVHGWFKTQDEWIGRPAADCRSAIEDAYQLVTGISAVDCPSYADFGRALQSIRTDVFDCTQTVLARILGASPSTYLRWESGQHIPSAHDWSRLVAFAKQAGFPVEHSDLFSLAETSFEAAHKQEKANGRRQKSTG